MEKPRCGTCPYWDGQEDDDGTRDIGACHRNAPSGKVRAPGPDFHEDSRVSWPTTWDFEWCGEHPGFPAYLRAKREEDIRNIKT